MNSDGRTEYLVRLEISLDALDPLEAAEMFQALVRERVLMRDDGWALTVHGRGAGRGAIFHLPPYDE